MKFSILQSDFWPILQSVARSSGVRSQLPVLGNILLSAQQGRIKLAATNLEIGVVKSIPAEIEEEGEITVPAKTLVDIVSNLSSEKIDFQSNIDQLKLTTASFSSQINGIPATEFPIIPLSGTEVTAFDPKQLTQSLAQVNFAAAVDEGRPTLTGILTQIEGNKLQLVATDGYRLAHKTVELSQEEGQFKALVPRKTFEEIMRLISEEEADQIAVSLSDDQNQIIFSFGNTQLSSRLIEGQFPSWEKIIPTEIKARVIVERGELLKAVKLASVFARSESNILKLHNKEGKLILSSEAKELGNQKKEIDAQIEGEEIVIAFNAKYLLDVLGAFSNSQALIELSGPLSAALVKPMGEETLKYIIMPINLS